MSIFNDINEYSNKPMGATESVYYPTVAQPPVAENFIPITTDPNGPMGATEKPVDSAVRWPWQV